ncbi:MAG: endolytic transglycosylase MltG [Kiloniellaceae bacterium]
MWRFAGRAALAGAALLIVAAAVALYGIDRFERPGPLEADSIVFIPRGAGLAAIAGRLQGAGVIDDALVFRLGVRALGATRRLRAGEYRFPAGVSMRGAVGVLISGQTVLRRLTLPEGLTSAEAVALIADAEFLDGESGPMPAEGSLLPETYHFARGDARAGLIRRMQRARDALLAELWPNRAGGLPFDTPEEAVILASIVEKETGVPEERALVASVFVNRLKKGMRLQSDPTVVYGLTGGKGPLGRALTRQDLRTPGPYNTYLSDGLPAGPIANPGRAAIESVLNPAQTEVLYFVADGDGGHTFARTLEEHNRNVARWRKVKRQQDYAE